MARRYVRGDRAFKKLIRRLPPSARQQMIVQLNLTGREQLAKDQAEAPVGRRADGTIGALRGALSMRVLTASLKLKVGLIGKPVNRRVFWGWIIERGRKAGGKGNKKGSRGYAAGHGKRAAQHFVLRTSAEMAAIAAPFKSIWDRTLRAASSGLNDD